MTSDTSHHMEGGITGGHDDLYTKYQEIDRFRVILAHIHAAPKSGTAQEVYEALRSLLEDDAKVLKRADDSTRVEVTMSAASLLKHLLDCDDCKNKQEICTVIVKRRQSATDTSDSETESVDAILIESRVGELALEQLAFPVQRNPSEDL